MLMHIARFLKSASGTKDHKFLIIALFNSRLHGWHVTKINKFQCSTPLLTIGAFLPDLGKETTHDRSWLTTQPWDSHEAMSFFRSHFVSGSFFRFDPFYSFDFYTGSTYWLVPWAKIGGEHTQALIGLTSESSKIARQYWIQSVWQTKVLSPSSFQIIPQ